MSALSAHLLLLCSAAVFVFSSSLCPSRFRHAFPTRKGVMIPAVRAITKNDNHTWPFRKFELEGILR
jgi:hypothetical protein